MIVKLIDFIYQFINKINLLYQQISLNLAVLTFT